MSPSKILDTDHPSKCELLQAPQIQNAKWRHGSWDTPQQNTKTEEGLQRSSLSENEDTTLPETSSNILKASDMAPTSIDPPPSSCSRIFITLADESPRRYSEQSDSCTYDSFNYQETDICRDSSDTDSSSSGNIIKTIEFEYDVASISSQTNLFSDDSSSGTEGNVLQDKYASLTSLPECSSSFADIECLPSDDSELTAADYWTCSKCKNKNNNPRFHCCEKCYQIRRSYYPPRPRRRRSRRPLESQDNSIIGTKSYKARSRSLVKRRSRWSKASSSSSAISSCESATLEKHSPTEIGLNRAACGMFMGDISKNRLRVADSSSDESFILENSKQTNHCEVSSPRVSNVRLTAKKRKTCEDENISAKRMRSDDTEILLTPNDKDIETDLPFSQSIVDGSQISQKDSGFGSNFSSQENKSISSEQQHYDDDTVSEELDEKDLCEMSKEKSPAFSPSRFESNPDESKSNLSLRMCSEPIIQSLYSVSDCSVTLNLQKQVCSSLTKSRESNVMETKVTTNSDPDYGLCMTCSNEPKNGVFVHSRFLHLCCCYKCAVKIWNKNQRCPICNCAVKNVLKLFVY